MKAEWVWSIPSNIDLTYALTPIISECAMKKKESSPTETSVSMSEVEPKISLWGEPEQEKELFFLLFIRECSRYLKTHALHAYPGYNSIGEPDLWTTIQRTVKRVEELEAEVKNMKMKMSVEKEKKAA